MHSIEHIMQNDMHKSMKYGSGEYWGCSCNSSIIQSCKVLMRLDWGDTAVTLTSLTPGGKNKNQGDTHT